MTKSTCSMHGKDSNLVIIGPQYSYIMLSCNVLRQRNEERGKFRASIQAS